MPKPVKLSALPFVTLSGSRSSVRIWDNQMKMAETVVQLWLWEVIQKYFIRISARLQVCDEGLAI